MSKSVKRTFEPESRTDDSHPFGMQWMDSCYQETLLPNGPWQSVHDVLTHELAERMKKQLDIPERRQMLFELLGQQFVQQFFPNEQFLPALCMPPLMAPEARAKLQIDAQNWLQSTLNKIALDTGSQRSLQAEQSGVPQSQEVQDFLKHTAFIFAKGMNRELYLQEREIEQQWENTQWQKEQAKLMREDARERRQLRQEYERLKGINSSVRSVLRTMVPPSTAGSTISVTSNVKGAEHGLEEDPPALWGLQSNSLGRSVLHILQRDPRRFAEVAARLHGRQLPATLRVYVWLDVLLRQERHKLGVENIEKIVRERFGKACSRGVGELRIQRATHSPIHGLIDTAVTELYEKTPAMKMFTTEEPHMKESAKALNILYTYDRSYEPYLIYWLFPLQLAFQDNAGQSEHVYELAMYLDLLNKSCFPKWPEIFAIAEKTMKRLKDADRELYDHLKTVAQIEPTVNPKEFMVQLIHEEKTQAKDILKTDLGSSVSLSDSKSLAIMADPIVFIRRWVGEGFVGVLDTQAAVYVWDQFFMQKWLTQPIEDVCLALLLLLRYLFMKTTNYQQMREVFLDQACRIYTMDLQQAWRHIQNRQPLDQVHLMNRQRPSTPTPGETARSQAASPSRPASIATSGRSVHLLSVGIKDIRTKLILTAEAMNREKWLSDIAESRLYLVCTIYYGEVEMETQKSYVQATKKSDNTGKDSRTISYAFPKMKFVFLDVDLSRYDLEREMGSVPYAIIRVEYMKPGVGGDDTPTVLGASTKIQLYKDSRDPMSQWQLQIGRDVYPIVPTLPEPAGDDTPRLTGGELLGNGSELSAMLFDPHKEPRSALATPLTPLARTPTPRTSATPGPWQPGIKDTFNIYVDGVDNIPDSATIIKVTGRLVKTGQLTHTEDILAFPELSGSARNPRFKYRLVVNEERASADPRMLLLMRCYTVDVDTLELVVIGSCLVELFDHRKQTLNLGGYKHILRTGMPDLKNGIEPLNQGSLDDHTRIPACTLYFRLAAHTDNMTVPDDTLTSSNYRMLDSAYTSSEKRVIDSYSIDAMFPATEKQMVERLMLLEDKKDKNVDAWRKARLDNNKHLPPNVPAGNLDLNRLVQYRIARGISIQVTGAYGLPEGQYVQALCRVIPGKNAKNLPTTSEGWGGAEKMLTSTHDLNSFQTAPKWTDKATEFHPHADPHSMVIIQLFGIEVLYTPHKQHSAPGTVRNKRSGAKLTLGAEQCLAWTVLPLFDKSYVLNGIHHLPLFRGEVPSDIMDAMQTDLPENIFQGNQELRKSKMPGAAMTVKLWDNHFKSTQIPATMQNFNFLLESVGTKEEYEESARKQKGPRMSQPVIDALPPNEKKKGTDSDMYITEAMYYQSAVGDVFLNMMKQYCVAVGYGPLDSRNTPQP